MDKTEDIFNAFKDRGDAYMLIVQKRQESAEPLTIIRGGKRGNMLMEQMQWCSTSPYAGGIKWGFSFVALLNTEEPWEEHASYLRSLDFKW
jgi:hypothetical protein